MKDPAVLFYIGDWLKSTAELDADARGWYLNLLLHNYDKQDLPSNIEDLATLAVVKFSEFNRFKQVFEQVLNNKFEILDNGRLSNPRINDILKKRENFVEKRSNAGKVSYVMKYFANNYPKEFKNKKMCDYVKNNFDYTVELKNQTKIKQVFEQVFELYINENENEDVNKKEDNSIEIEFNEIWILYKKKGNRKTSFDKYKKLSESKRIKIKNHVPNYVNSVSDIKFIKNFETYLNQEHWENEIVVNKDTPKQPIRTASVQYHKPGDPLI